MGFTIPEIDTILAKYAELSYSYHYQEVSHFADKVFYFASSIDNQDIASMLETEIHEEAFRRTIREIEQGLQGFETKLNTISNSLGQVPFVTITFGLNTSIWGREIAKAILNVRLKGMGEHKTTAVFPKLSFLHREEINGKEGSPNYDIKLLAIKCNKKRIYPDWLSLDYGHLKEVYDRSGKVVSGMGCRAFLSPFYDENEEEIYIGRSNIGAVSLNLPKIALESNGDWNKFFDLIDKYSQIGFDIHEDTYKKLSKTKGSSNPLYFCEGGAWTKVGMDEEVGKIYEASTASLGYVGLEEMINAMGMQDNRKEVKEKVLKYLKKLTNDATIKYNHLYALYSTPAESLCYRFQNINKKDYGEIEGVTDREYMTNSFHIPVWEDITVPDKIVEEAAFHQIATGGKISYNEFKPEVDEEVLLQAVNFAMKNGMYYGINIVSSSCNNCGHNGEFYEVCPKCSSSDIIVVNRVCGYLSFQQINGESRYNPGKEQEIKDRVKHN